MRASLARLRREVIRLGHGQEVAGRTKRRCRTMCRCRGGSGDTALHMWFRKLKAAAVEAASMKPELFGRPRVYNLKTAGMYGLF